MKGALLGRLRAEGVVRALKQAPGRAQIQLKQEMIETFGAATINAIPDEQWEDVLAWCLWRTRQPG